MRGDDERGFGRRHGTFAAACLIAATVVVAAYSNHFDNGFHFDDSHVIVNNLSIRSLHDLPRFFTDPLTFTARPQNAVYRPLLTLSFALDYRLGGLEPRQFHITQFALLMVLGALLVFLFARILDRSLAGSPARWAGLAGATLFCVHTANTETVNYITSRSSLVATLGVVGSFVLWVGWPRGRRWHVYLLPMLVCGLAKPLTVMFGPLLLVYVLLFDENRSLPDLATRPGRRALGQAVLRSAPALVAGAALFVFLRSMDADTLEYADVDRWTYARTQPFVWLHYVRLFLLPVGLTADTDWVPLESWLDVRLLVGSVFIAALLAVAVLTSRNARNRPIAFGLIWFAVALLPTSSLFPLSEVYNEHRIFFPYVGLCLAAAATVTRLLSRVKHRRAAAVTGAVLAIGVIAAHGVGTHARNEVWKDGESLWRDVTIKSPRNGRGLMNYGLALMGRGETEQALALYERALELVPNYSVLHVNLGIAKSRLGRQEAAEWHFKRALELAPGYAAGHFYYARWLVRHARTREAIPLLRRALQLSPGDQDANRLLLEIHAAMDDRPALIARARRVLEIAPGDATATAYLENRVPYEVDGDSAEAYAQAAWVRLGFENWLAAAVLYRETVRRDPESANSWNDLGWALGKAGLYDLAIPCFELASRLDPELDRARANLRWARENQSAAASGGAP